MATALGRTTGTTAVPGGVLCLGSMRGEGAGRTAPALVFPGRAASWWLPPPQLVAAGALCVPGPSTVHCCSVLAMSDSGHLHSSPVCGWEVHKHHVASDLRVESCGLGPGSPLLPPSNRTPLAEEERNGGKDMFAQGPSWESLPGDLCQVTLDTAMLLVASPGARLAAVSHPAPCVALSAVAWLCPTLGAWAVPFLHSPLCVHWPCLLPLGSLCCIPRAGSTQEGRPGTG